MTAKQMARLLTIDERRLREIIAENAPAWARRHGVAVLSYPGFHLASEAETIMRDRTRHLRHFLAARDKVRRCDLVIRSLGFGALLNGEETV